jgi:adenylate kinase family enzyme
MMKKKILIEFYGGAGSGKSLQAHALSNYLKLSLPNKVVEFSKEQAQEMYWEGRISSMSNLIKVLGRQTEHYDVRFDGGADIVIADTALNLASYYDKTITDKSIKKYIVDNIYLNYDHVISIWCLRHPDKSKYTTVGRLQTYEESVKIDKELQASYGPFDIVIDPQFGGMWKDHVKDLVINLT